MLRAADRVAHQPLVEVINATFSYPERTVLNGVHFHISAGEIVVLLGPNGAGKSTLSKAICGRLALQSGETRVNGACPVKSPDVRGIIGLVPQTIALYEKLTVRENLQIFGKLMQVPKNELQQRTDKTLLDIGLAERADTIVSALSGGMQRRVNIGVALMHNPELLVLDEPTAGVDYEARAQLAEVLRALRNKGLAILLTTHDMEEAEILADRVAIMTHGKIQACGYPADLIDQVFHASRELRVVTTSCPNGREEASEETLFVSVDDPKLGELLNACANSTNELEELRLRRPDLQSLVEFVYAQGDRA